MKKPSANPNQVGLATRRTFLQSASAACLSLPLAAPTIHAADKAGRKNPIVGTGEHL